MSGPPWFVANEVLAFVLEVLAIAALCRRGFTSGPNAVPRVVLGVAVPGVAVVLWALFAAPRARRRPSLPGVPAVKALVLLGAAAAPYALGHPVLAAVFAVLVVADTTVAETSRPRVAGR